ncbi:MULTISPECIES: ESPR-type extended signal peptide-containing protein [Burkholderia]|nr:MULTISPECIES: ESPR-type extended signal peptide-containing protein [Burkholderia]
MNKTYRSIFNVATGTWTAASELAKGGTKGGKHATALTTIMAAVIALTAPAAEAANYAAGTNATVGATAFGCNIAPAPFFPTGCTGNLTTYGTAVGDNSSANAGVAFGDHAMSTGGLATALGAYSYAVYSGTAVGTGAYAQGQWSTALGRGANAVTDSSVALGTGASATGSNSIALGTNTLADRNNAVSVGTTAARRQIINVADGTQANDAVNFGQMNAGLSTTNASIAATNATLSTTNSTLSTTNRNLSTTTATLTATNTALSTTNATLAATNTALSAASTTLSTAQNTIAGHTSEIADINKQLGELSSGSIGLVKQSAAGADLTVGANTDGAAVNFKGTAGDRQLSGIAAGTLDSDAVNVGQLNARLSTTNAAIDATQAGLSTTNTTLAATNTALSTAQDTIATHTDDIADINDQLNGLSSGTIGLVQQAAAGMDLTVGANTDGAAVNFKGTTGERKLTGIAAGDVSTASTDAVNGAQLHGVSESVAAAIGGDSKVNPDGSISAPSFTVGDGNGGTTTVGTVAGAVSNLDDRTTANEGSLAKLADQVGSGTVGLVQQSAAGADLTVGANTDGAAVNFKGTAGERKLTGIAAGDVSTASTDAINGAQLHGAADSVAAAIGGDSKVNPDGSISAPSFTVGDGSGGTTTAHTVASAVSNLDGRMVANEGAITDLDGRTTANEGSLSKLADQIGSGTVGLVQQANAGDDLTVGANTDGAAVNFTGTAGTRKLTGITAGDVSAASTDAVNGAQLHGVADSVASAIGGGSTVNPDGSISAPSFTVGDGSGGTKIVNSVGDVVTNLNDRVTGNEGGIQKLSEQIGSGAVGLVQQNPTTGAITVGAGTGGSTVNFAGAGGSLRTLSGVANGVDDDDVVTVSQLRATGLIDYAGKEVGAVTYDSGLSFDSVTFAGSNGTVLKQVAAGTIERGGMEAVNGGQLFDLQEQFAQRFGELSGQVGNLSDRVDNLSGNLGAVRENIGTGGVGTGEGSTVVGEGAVASGKNSSAIGDGAVASGENSSAVGQGAVASGNNGSAIGQGSVASGNNSSAVGQGSVASGADSTALGQGASATASNAVAVGHGSVATEANTVSFGDGTEAGNRRLVNIADGMNASDAATKGQLDRAMDAFDQRLNDTNRAINDVAKNAYAGIAAAMAMPNMTPSAPGKTVVALGAANFKSGSAVAAGATYRSRNGNWLVNGAMSMTSVGDAGIRAQVGYEF